jgi:hypothetical protein
VRLIPAARNEAENAPTAIAMTSMKKPIPLPSSRTTVVQIVRSEDASATAAPAR